MRKIFTLVLSIAVVAFIVSCNDGNNRRFGSRAWNQSLSLDDLALERAIIADIMGGVAAERINPEEMTLSGLEPLEGEDETNETIEETTEETTNETTEAVNKISISVPIEQGYGGDYLTNTSDTFEYEGPSGGTLTIDVRGDFKKLNNLFGDDAEMLFTPLHVDFIFDNYVYVNSCGLFSRITGTVSCTLQGEVDRKTDLIEANGSCSSGSNSSAGKVLYSIGEEESHEVLIQTSLRAKGPWYELTSYSFFGTYTIDSRTGTIDSVVSSPLVLCQEQY